MPCPNRRSLDPSTLLACAGAATDDHVEGDHVSVPSTMKAVVLTGHGGLDKLQYRDDVPVPAVPPGEVLVEVSACGLNNTDVWVREGAYGLEDDPAAVSTWRRGRSTLEFPRIQGTDTVGRIAAVGDGVSEERIGERVMVDFSIYNRDDESLADIDYMGHGRDGGYAEYQAVPADHAHVVDRDIADAQLATFCCAYLTAEQMLDRARVAEGERVLVTGASGGVGSGIIQLCRARGAIPYAVTSAGKAEAVRALGAEDVVLRGDGELVEQVETMMGGHPVDVAADLVGGDMFNDLLRILRPEGRYTTAGAIGGPVVQLDLRTMYLKQLELHGSSQGTRTAFRRLVRYIEEGAIDPLLAGTYRLSDFHQAQTAFMSKGFVGNIVVVPDAKWDEYGAPHAAG
jgi:NADPH:quinone reductase-like Zn-dependent oxidoreductase